MRKFPADLRPPRFPPAPPDTRPPVTLDDLEERIRRLESSGALEAATTSDGGMVINEFTINDDGSLVGADQPFYLTDFGRINSINSDPPTADQAVTAGADCQADAPFAWAEGWGNTAGGDGAHAEGIQTEASGFASHAEGAGDTASGVCAHAEGRNTLASATAAHAEGDDTEASGVAAHAEGTNTLASGQDAHAEGVDTIASGFASHAEGFFATAALYSEHAQGGSTFGQYSRLLLQLSHNDATPTPLALANGAPVPVPAGELWMMTVEVAAIQISGSGAGLAGFTIAGAVGYPGGVLALIDVPTGHRWGFGNGLTWDATLDVDGANLAVLVTGQAGHLIHWIATVHATRIRPA